jgi:ribonuclease HI
VKDKQPNSKVLKDKTNTKVFEILDRSIQWLQQNTFASKIEKWETKVWGENPADFGRK